MKTSGTMGTLNTEKNPMISTHERELYTTQEAYAGNLNDTKATFITENIDNNFDKS